ncbi:pyridoxamine 5'-phosphate oxidase family protein [Secundilactobacillus folii]|uniref:Pyridoxamine 5'-phosphate oxidase family protein n=1 Tax=Secundilactobacillus folii TaxID=2678357 RepID=A0A7X2XWS9_9LACO|nr:pyridoxamine 5'-phosphate oxidase family protein [Secundilactobacillus folii]MTV81741.1 pyridoxamine 5'-phosphate oxidase family protein [Secundilactobacillus folii]
MRRTDREITDEATKQAILANAKVINLGILDFPAPYVVPTNYGYEMVAGKLRLYIHGASEGRKRGLIAANPNVSFSIIDQTGLYTPADGEPVSHYSYFYRSLLGSGVATLVDDLTEKEHALRLVLKHEVGHEVPGEISQHDLEHVGVIRVDVEQYTGKQHLAN